MNRRMPNGTSGGVGAGGGNSPGDPISRHFLAAKLHSLNGR